jgi:hypothetical protein
MKWLVAALAVALLLVRVPSVVQPAGGDQGIYAYVGQSILRGEMPYRDAWDQKPPGVHLTYAAMLALWPSESVVPATDLLVSAVVAALLFLLGRRLAGPGAGEGAALVFLLLADPSFQRLSGLWVRAQGETFIAALVTGALLACLASVNAGCDRGKDLQAVAWSGLAGLLLGAAFLYKYNAGIYVCPALAVYVAAIPEGASRDPRNRGLRVLARQLPALVAGFVLPVALVGAWFATRGGVDDLVQATLIYNLRYSEETYHGPLGFVRFLAMLPVRHASVDALWLVGGASCALLVPVSFRNSRLVIAPLWFTAACVSIAVNGSRELPQYFVQAAPALALAAGAAGTVAWRTLGPLARAALVVLLAIGVVRVDQFDKWADHVAFDLARLRGAVARPEYLARFGGQRSTDKFSALATATLGDRLKWSTAPADRVLVLGFSPGALVCAGRRSASRFFWSRPLLVGFNEGRPGYGVAGLLSELTRNRPAEVVLQQRDWPAEGVDSATWFLHQPALRAWLIAHYRQVADTGTYFIYRRLDLP